MSTSQADFHWLQWHLTDTSSVGGRGQDFTMANKLPSFPVGKAFVGHFFGELNCESDFSQ